jgi:(4S)-4-hydroxy-5-phosphonooxypentane-2,3-dione isomerase
MTVALFVEIETKPGRRDAYLARANEHRKNVLSKEAWCQRFDVMIPKDNENMVCLYEVYDDEDGFKAHGETQHMQEYRADTGEMIADRKVMLSTIVD